MRKIIGLVLCLLMCMGLTSCTVLNAWIVKGDVKDVKGAYPPGSGEAGRGDVIFSRYFLWTTEKAKPLIESIPNMKVSVVGIETHQWSGMGGKFFSTADIKKILNRAIKLGINFIDTGECYFFHSAERLIGEALGRNRSKFII